MKYKITTTSGKDYIFDADKTLLEIATTIGANEFISITRDTLITSDKIEAIKELG